MSRARYAGQLALYLARPRDISVRWGTGFADHLTTARTAFAWGFHAALSDEVGSLLQGPALDRRLRGFAYEGVGLAETLLGLLTECCDDPPRIPDGHGPFYAIGAGWAHARLGRPLPTRAAWGELMPMVEDGFGFHEGLTRPFAFRTGKFEARGPGVDHGLGRSLWFHRGAAPVALTAAIEALPSSRQPALWLGVGRAATYCGGGSAETLSALFEGAGRHRAELGEGANQAQEAYRRWGVEPEHCHLAQRILNGV